MTVKVIEEIHCDRCKVVFEKRGFTMEIGWFKFRNGSGGKATSYGRSHDNLDYDLCEDCSDAFVQWWEKRA